MGRVATSRLVDLIDITTEDDVLDPVPTPRLWPCRTTCPAASTVADTTRCGSSMPGSRARGAAEIDGAPAQFRCVSEVLSTYAVKVSGRNLEFWSAELISRGHPRPPVASPLSQPPAARPDARPATPPQGSPAAAVLSVNRFVPGSPCAAAKSASSRSISLFGTLASPIVYTN
jgi:hypothetical protein